MENEKYVRRIQLVAGSTYAVALPKHWAKDNNIRKGSLVEVTVLPGGGILIEPVKEETNRGLEKNKTVAKVEFSADKYSRALREIISSYIAGAEVIEVYYNLSESEIVDKLMEQLHNILLGVEVLEREPGIVRLYAVLDDYAVSFWDGYSKMKRAVIGMLKTMDSAISSDDETLARLVIRRDDMVDRLYLYLVRQMTRSLLEARAKMALGLESPAEAPHIFLAIKSLERIGDHSTIIASIAIESGGPKHLKEIQYYLGKTQEIVMKASSLIEKPDKDEADKQATIASSLRKTLRELSDKWSPFLARAATSLERINGYAQDVLEASIDIQTIRDRASFIEALK